jgi:CRP/FNR family transcriptional regulator
MTQTISSLRGISLFSGLSDSTLTLLSREVVRRAFHPGEIIILEGEPCRAAYFVISGIVDVIRSSPGGREQVLTRLGPGEGFNTVPSFHSLGQNHASVHAVTEVEVYVIESVAFRRLVTVCGEFALAVLADFAQRLDHLTGLVEDLSLHSVRGRLASFLVTQAGEDGAVVACWTQEEIASHIGTVRDVVGRTLRAFADEGLLRFERQRIVLVDRAGLEREMEL